MAKLSSAVVEDLAAAAEEFADFVGDEVLVFLVVELGADPVVEDLGVELVEGGEREVGDGVVGIFAAAEGLLLLVVDADDGEGAAGDDDVFADGVFGAEEVFGDVVAEDGDVGGAVLVGLGEEAAGARAPCRRRGVRRSVAFEADVLRLVQAVVRGFGAGIELIVGVLERCGGGGD